MHQKAFNPFGGMVVAGTILTVSHVLFQGTLRNILPRAFRKDAEFMTKCGIGGTYGALAFEAVTGWARLTDGQQRFNSRAALMLGNFTP